MSVQVLQQPAAPHLLALPDHPPALFRSNSGPSAFGRNLAPRSQPIAHSASPHPRSMPAPGPIPQRPDPSNLPRSSSAPQRIFHVDRRDEPEQMSEDERMAQIAYRNFTTTCRGTPLKTRLLDAAISQDDALFILLLKKHPDLANEQNWATDPLFNNALHRAVGHKEQDNSDLVYAWLEAGGPVTAQTSNGETALNIACRAGNYSCANMLFEWHRQNSIPTEDRNAQGLAPLHYVLSYKHPQPPAQGASHLNNPNESPDLAEKIVMYMDAWGTSEWRDLGHRMIQSMGDVNIPIARSLTPLHCVVAYKKINDTQDPFGLSLYIPLLMQRGADINRQTAPDDGGETIFHIIARRNDRELLDSLFTAQGASLPLIAPNAVHWQLQNAQGKTALQVATESGHAELATRLAALSAQGN